jgi:hypothetical protein
VRGQKLPLTGRCAAPSPCGRGSSCSDSKVPLLMLNLVRRFLSPVRHSCMLTDQSRWIYSAFDSLVNLWISIHVQSNTHIP